MNTIFSAMEHAVAAQTMSDSDGVNLLIMMSDNGVRQKVREAFTAQMQNSKRVQSTFFSKPDGLLAPLPAVLEDWVGQVASALVALSLAQCSGHGFKDTVKSEPAQQFLTSCLNNNNANFMALAMSNYQSLFPVYCTAKNIGFGSFLSGTYGARARWGSLLADRLSSKAYINQEMIKLNAAVDPNNWYQVFFANIYKVQCLNAAEVQRVLNAWDPKLKGKEQPGKKIQWTIYEYMTAAAYSPATFMGQVQNAINVGKIHMENRIMFHPREVWMVKMITYGDAVNQWLSNNKGFGSFIVGPSRNNSEQAGGGCCFTPGTPILLCNGRAKAIETVEKGDAVVSRGGKISTRSAQDVHWRIESNEYIYGINDYTPFFTASHPFMTTEGWKSISPQASYRMNPDIQVGRLKKGDVLLQAEDGRPFGYRKVEILEITKILAQDAHVQDIHSLHLEQENPGYHANGFLVAVNYPQLREDQFIRAFAGISEAERAYLRSHFEALVPFLRRGLGNYINEIFDRALGSGGNN